MRIVIALLLSTPFAATAAPAAEPGVAYEPEEIIGWQEQRFAGVTGYRLIDAESAGAPHAAVRADCDDGTASGRLLEREISLEETPILEWRWRVDSVYAGLDETTRSGDDYAARVYVIAKRWPAFRSRAINYVWSNSEPVGSAWENAFAGQFMMVAVQSGPERAGEWVAQRRDVAADFRRFHDLDLDTVDALAIMTDCDNAGQTTTAWYGPIRWRAAEAE